MKKKFSRFTFFFVLTSLCFRVMKSGSVFSSDKNEEKNEDFLGGRNEVNELDDLWRGL